MAHYNSETKHIIITIRNKNKKIDGAYINTGGEISHGGRYIGIYLLHHERICQDQAEKSELCSK